MEYNFWTDMLRRIRRPFRIFFTGIYNLYLWLPTIWTDRQWDYTYFINIQLKKLDIMHNYYSNPKNVMMCEESRKHIVSRIDTARRLMDMIYLENKYSDEHLDEIIRLYGNREYKFMPSESNPEHEIMVRVFEKQYTSSEIDRIIEHEAQLRNNCAEKDKKAKRILWQFINHNLEDWWD